MSLSQTYRTNLALLTDLYQLTMARTYHAAGIAEREAVFHLFFRRPPFDGGFAVAAGLEPVIDLLREFRFDESDLAHLASLRSESLPLFDEPFLEALRELRFTCDVDAIPEGTLVFGHEPLLRIVGPILQCQLLESALLNLINFQTLIATKAARVCLAAGDQPVIEFGLRRAQGVDGALAASRAAYIGGCTATSNVLASKLLGIPVRGTHAHSMVMAFDREIDAFRAYAAALPDNCIFLVDTYDTLQGVRAAIQVGRELRERGHRLVGIRLDSGDLAYLSREARRMLDDAGFPDAKIVASNDLDERIIESLRIQGAAIDMWGVGSKLITAFDEPAIGGVYKLAALRDQAGEWRYVVKLSEQAIKISTPGILQVRRFRDARGCVADAVYDSASPTPATWTIVDPVDMTRRKRLDPSLAQEDLLVPVFRGGRCIYAPPALADIRERTRAQLGEFHAGVKRFVNPHAYPVGLELALHDLKTRLVLEARGVDDAD